jgi:hypothetical protein
MHNRSSLFRVSFPADFLKTSQEFTQICYEKILHLRAERTVAECVEPHNPSITQDFSPTQTPKRFAVPSYLSSYMSQLFKLTGLASLAATASAQNLTINVGTPNGSIPVCQPSGKWLQCVEVYVANGTEVLSRFAAAGMTYYNGTSSTTAERLSDAIASTADPLIALIKDVMSSVDVWRDERFGKCSFVQSCTERNYYLDFAGTTLSLDACWEFQKSALNTAGDAIRDNEDSTTYRDLQIAGIVNAVVVAVLTCAVAAKFMKAYKENQRLQAEIIQANQLNEHLLPNPRN